MLDPAEVERRVASTTVAFRVARDAVEATGPDVTTYLQGQLSQDLTSLAEGSSRWSLLLQPQGKVDTWLRVTNLGPERWLLDTDPGAGEHLIARLERFKLRTKATFEPLEWSMVALRGPGSGEVAAPAGCVAVDPEWPGTVGRDLLGPDPSIPDGVAEGDHAGYEVLRVRAGVPAMGRELTERTIPAEAGVVERSVSFTKGCYVGQELVARIDSRGSHTPRRLLGLLVDGDAAPDAGAPVTADGAEVGAVTSAVHSAELGPIALAYLRRVVEMGATVQVAAGTLVTSARVVALPFARAAR
jgi:tRNA-modifying protein YgfZ